MVEQNLSRLLIISIIFLLITILCGSLIREISIIFDYQKLPIKDYTITTFILGTLIFLINHFYFQKLIIKNKTISSITIWSIFF